MFHSLRLSSRLDENHLWAIVIFCYRGEEEILPLTIEQARTTLPLANIHLFDDKADPIPGKLADALEEMAGVHYHQTSFNRGVNLNGAECIRGELQCMVNACDDDGNTDGVVIKMDPDTLILRSGPLLDAISKGAEWVSHNSMKGHFAGMFYAMRRGILDMVHRNAKLIELPEGAAEDETIGALCYLAAQRKSYVWTDISNPQNRQFFAAFPAQVADEPTYAQEIRFVAKHGCIITVGNTNILGMPRAYRVKIMRDLLKEYRNPTEDEALAGIQEEEPDLPPAPAPKAATPKAVAGFPPDAPVPGGNAPGITVVDDEE